MRLVATIFVFVLAMNVWATGQEGDVITIDGERWTLMGKPIDRDSVLYRRLKEVLPKDREINTANWDGYKAYWSIRDNRLCLDRIEVERYNEVGMLSHVEIIPEDDMRKVFGKYYQQQEIVATWVNGTIRVAKGNVLYYVHSGFIRNLEHEQILTVEQGKVTKREAYHNHVVVKDGFSFDNMMIDEFRRRFPLHTENYPELVGVKQLIITIGNVQLDEKGNLVDCNIKVTHRDGSIEGLAQEMKTLLKKIHPWKTLYINGEYVSTRYHESINFAYRLDS